MKVTFKYFMQKILKNPDCFDKVEKIKIHFETTEQLQELSDKKSAIEHALRIELMTTCIADLNSVENIVKLSIELARLDLVSAFFPVALLVDVFDVKALDFCESLFKFVEDNVSVFKESHFFTPCKNSLLRMCNDLLRRLSRSQNTVFCGRILMFLAKFFPFSERSGLNVVSEFNVENTTEFENTTNNAEGNNEDVSMAEPESLNIEESSSIKIDRHLYLKFWALQEFFRCPYTCYDKEKYKKFCSYTKDVLSAFKSFKLEETETKSGKDFMPPKEMMRNCEENENFFAKFLTNPKLLSLQLGDSNFRRTILVQYLIFFQYLVSTIKFKGENDKLNEQQQEWVRETELTVYKLLDETPPRGKEFSTAIRHILKREEIWNNWKNDGCKEIKRPDGFDKKVDLSQQRKRKCYGDEVHVAAKVAKFDLANQELSRLWNLCPDNLQAGKGSDRNFLPPLEIYLEKPEKNDPSYEWRALRLVSKQSSHFFTLIAAPNERLEKIGDYLKLFNQKIQKDKTEIKAEALGSGIEIIDQSEGLVDDGENHENIDEPTEEDENQHKTTRASAEQIVEISKKVGDDWRKLGSKLGIDKRILEDYSASTSPCQIMLTDWFAEDDDASLENLAYILEGLELLDATNLVKKMIDVDEN
jgi:THO complex subunit 1